MKNKNIKIIFITARADFGGGPEHLYRLVSHLSPNFTVFIAAPNDYPYFERYRQLTDNEVITIPHRKFALTALLKLRRIIKDNRIDIIHSHGKGAGVYSRIAAMLTGRKCIHTFHGFHIGSYGAIGLNMYILLEKIFARFTSRFICVSAGEKEEILKYNITSSAKIDVIMNGVELPRESINLSAFHADTKKVISFTRYDYQKNSEMLFEIINRLERLDFAAPFEFHLLGEGDEIETFRGRVKDTGLGNKIFVHGVSENPLDYLVGGFCYISTSRWEGLPLALLEAMSVGLPVIASNVVGNRDIIENGVDGLLFDPGNSKSAAEQLITLSKNITMWEKFSNAGREKIKKEFSIENMVTSTEKLYTI